MSRFNRSPSPAITRDMLTDYSNTIEHPGVSKCCANCDADPNRKNRKAVLFGLNYRGTANELRGCINDVRNLKDVLIKQYGLSTPHIKYFTDDTPNKPTLKNILKAMQWLTANAKPGDELYFHYSGHGTQVPYAGAHDPRDPLAEAMVPLDHNNCSNLLLDTMVTDSLFDKVATGVSLCAVMDCCHSGTMANDLNVALGVGDVVPSKKRALSPSGGEVKSRFLPPPPHLLMGREPVGVRSIKEGAAKDTFEPGAILMMFSGCQDHQTSADAVIDGTPQGAFTWSLLKTLKENNYHLTYRDLITGAARTLKSSRYDQDPQLSTVEAGYLEKPFMEKDGGGSPGGAPAPAIAPAPAPASPSKPPSMSGGGGGAAPSSPMASNRPSLGMRLGNTNHGISVLEVSRGGIAEAAGFMERDIITAVEATPVTTTSEFLQTLRRVEARPTVDFNVERMVGASLRRLHCVVRYPAGGAALPPSPGPAPAPAPASPAPAPAGDYYPTGGSSDVPLSVASTGFAVSAAGSGCDIVDVSTSSLAAAAGLRVGDRIIAVASRAVRTPADMDRVFQRVAFPGVILPLMVQKKGRPPAAEVALRIEP